MPAVFDQEKFWSRFILKLKSDHPFFAAVALFARCKIDDAVDLAEIHDKTLHISPEYFSSIDEEERFSFILHQILHLSLGHIGRAKDRNQKLWNVAADIVANNIIHAETKLPIAQATAKDFRYSGYSAEKVYAILLKEAENPKSPKPQQQKQGYGTRNRADSQPGSEHRDQTNAEQNQIHEGDTSKSFDLEPSGSQSTEKESGIEQLCKRYNCHADFKYKGAENAASQEYWRRAMVKAKQIQKTTSWGKHSDALQREVDIAMGGSLDWRELLWKFATPAANDYEEFDHRFVHRNLYLEALKSEELNVEVVIDTSGSVGRLELERFIKEMLAIHACHPQVNLKFYYMDVNLYGPHEIPKELSDFPVPLGAGGTNFNLYFESLNKRYSLTENIQAVIFFTDGYVEFPSQTPETPVLWMVTEDGADDENFNFGTVVRLRS